VSKFLQKVKITRGPDFFFSAAEFYVWTGRKVLQRVGNIAAYIPGVGEELRHVGEGGGGLEVGPHHLLTLPLHLGVLQPLHQLPHLLRGLRQDDQLGPDPMKRKYYKIL
jgi:hypothetical protein